MIISGIEVKHVIFPPEYKRSRYAKFAIKNAWKNGAFVSVLPKIKSGEIQCGYNESGLIFLKMKESDYMIQIASPEWKTVFARKKIMPGEKQIRIYTPETEKIFSILNSMVLIHQ